MIRLESEFLDKVWAKWLEDKADTQWTRRRYKNISRREKRSQQFETWLYKQGAAVKQHNGNRYIEFYDEDLALMFVLKNA